MRQIAWLEQDGENGNFLQSVQTVTKAARMWSDIAAAKQGSMEQGWAVAGAYLE